MSYTRTATTATSILLAMSLTLPGAPADPSAHNLADRYVEKATAAESLVPEPTALVGPLTVYAESPKRVDDVVWAVDRYTDAGFDLPDVTVYLHDDRETCWDDPDRPISGYYTEVHGQPVVHVCAGRKTLLHELAHAWDHACLEDATRERFLVQQGLDEWHAATWRESGGEHLAAVVAWALEGTHPTMIGYYDTDELALAYEVATGMTVPTNGDDRRVPAVKAAVAIADESAPTYQGDPS